jgi:hypothetical protein
MRTPFFVFSSVRPVIVVRLHVLRYGLSRHILRRWRSVRYSTVPALRTLQLSIDSLAGQAKKSVDRKRAKP